MLCCKNFRSTLWSGMNHTFDLPYGRVFFSDMVKILLENSPTDSLQIFCKLFDAVPQAALRIVCKIMHNHVWWDLIWTQEFCKDFANRLQTFCNIPCKTAAIVLQSCCIIFAKPSNSAKNLQIYCNECAISLGDSLQNICNPVANILQKQFNLYYFTKI